MAHSPQRLNLPRAVLFDYDGVLVASEPIHLLAWMQLLKELGLPNDRKIIENHIGKTAPQILTKLLDVYKPGWDPEQYKVHELAQRKNVFYLSYAQTTLAAYPGALEGIQWLKSKNIRIAVVSNGRRREIEATMKQLGLWQYFDQVVSRDDVNLYKPDPTPYLFAAAALNLSPQDCLAVEDSPTGLEAALMARIPVAAILTNFSRESVETPVPGRPDLKPIWIGESLEVFFSCLKNE